MFPLSHLGSGSGRPSAPQQPQSTSPVVTSPTESAVERVFRYAGYAAVIATLFGVPWAVYTLVVTRKDADLANTIAIWSDQDLFRRICSDYLKDTIHYEFADKVKQCLRSKGTTASAETNKRGLVPFYTGVTRLLYHSVRGEPSRATYLGLLVWFTLVTASFVLYRLARRWNLVSWQQATAYEQRTIAIASRDSDLISFLKIAFRALSTKATTSHRSSRNARGVHIELPSQQHDLVLETEPIAPVEIGHVRQQGLRLSGRILQLWQSCKSILLSAPRLQPPSDLTAQNVVDWVRTHDRALPIPPLYHAWLKHLEKANLVRVLL
jgi:hypothetical protein